MIAEASVDVAALGYLIVAVFLRREVLAGATTSGADALAVTLAAPALIVAARATLAALVGLFALTAFVALGASTFGGSVLPEVDEAVATALGDVLSRSSRVIPVSRGDSDPAPG
jgi:hypothetical protein